MKPLKIATKSVGKRAAEAALAGISVFVLLFVADYASLLFGLQGSQRVLDDFFGGIIAGLLVFVYERARTRRLTRQLQTIALMNHHVRNALQVIAYSSYAPQEAQQLVSVRDAVERIEWALQEVLPQSVQDADEPAAEALAEPPTGGQANRG